MNILTLLYGTSMDDPTCREAGLHSHRPLHVHHRGATAACRSDIPSPSLTMPYLFRKTGYTHPHALPGRKHFGAIEAKAKDLHLRVTWQHSFTAVRELRTLNMKPSNCQEGISHEACAYAGHLGLGKLIAFYAPLWEVCPWGGFVDQEFL